MAATDASPLDDLDAALAKARAERDGAIAALVRADADLRRLEEEKALVFAETAASDHDDSGWISLKQAAGANGFSPESLRRWAERGLVAGRKEGGRWQVRTESIKARARKS